MDLWLPAFPIGTEKTLEEGGELYEKTVYLFGSTELQLLDVNGQSKRMVYIPVAVAVSFHPPSWSSIYTIKNMLLEKMVLQLYAILH
ncbi:hypothetical protein SETIT_2G415000v2 [Setaria italica]|uniref:Uncharacterized protein n=1 Tax=Setaria italica TaxID=4555 RepID=A0A368Q9B9_SETIT|nr:hypothetical protein SETIT_2G415000v2 [Setaria italica]